MGGAIKEDDVAPGWIDVWRLWRHCLCRFGWYPLFVAPLVTCACLLDLYSSTGCDFIRMNIGFAPINDVWDDSYAQLGLFSFDSHEMDRNKWKRTFNGGCKIYSLAFENNFIQNDQTWYVSRIMAYISGISSLVALATAWLLTITPLPASFFWPGVLLPAVVLSMLTGASKFLFFDTQICTEPLWYIDADSPPVAAQSCEIGESSVFGIASVAAYFFCTVLICFRSPQKRMLDENWGKRFVGGGGANCAPGSTVTHHTGTDVFCGDPEHGLAHAAGEGDSSSSLGVLAPESRVVKRGALERKEPTAIPASQHQSTRAKNMNSSETSRLMIPNHTRSTSDVTWSTGSNKPTLHVQTRGLSVLSPTNELPLEHRQQIQQQGEPRPDSAESSETEWNTYGRPIVVTINDSSSGHPEGGLSYSDGSSSADAGARGPRDALSSTGGSSNSLPPRHNGKTTIMGPAPQSALGTKHKNGDTAITNEKSSRRSDSYDSGSVASRISRISLADTHADSDEISALGMQSYTVGAGGASVAMSRSKPSVVAIPNIPKRIRSTFSSPGSSTTLSSGRKLPRYKRGSSLFTTELSQTSQSLQQPDLQASQLEQPPQSSNTAGSNRSMEIKPQILEYLPPLDEMSSIRSAEDHGDLINKCVRDLERSFVDEDNGMRTI